MRCLRLFPLVLALASCAGTTPSKVKANTGGTVTSTRPYGLYVPAQRAPMPLVVVLHGYSIDGAREVSMMRLDALARNRGFALAWPDGTKDAKGYRFWNATDACCNWFQSTVDDSAFLSGMIDEIAATHPIDRKRVFVVGHSNGAFMAHRFACEHADKVAAIATLAGVPWKDQERCNPSGPVSVLHMQGTGDPFILLGGGRIDGSPPYPSADDTVRAWARRNRCALQVREDGKGRYDFDTAVEGAETSKASYGRCAENTAVELWTLEGSSHEPGFSDAFASAIYDFLMDHPKP